MIEYSCNTCGKVLRQYWSKYKLYKHHYCSKKCSDLAKVNQSISPEIRAKMSIAHSGEKHWNYGKKASEELRSKLSMAHKGKKLSEETKRKLSINNARYWQGKKHSAETKKKISLIHKGKPLSGEHCRKISEAAPKGKDNHGWRGGVYPEHLKERHSAKHIKWSRAVKKRDKNICLSCGKNYNLIAHHIKQFNDNPESRYDINNGITLCRKCHIQIHKPTRKTRRQDNCYREALFFSPHCLTQKQGELL